MNNTLQCPLFICYRNSHQIDNQLNMELEQTNSSISSLLDIRMKKVLLKQHITNDTISVQTLKVIFVNG